LPRFTAPFAALTMAVATPSPLDGPPLAPDVGVGKLGAAE
jgi:hypothetical protein